MKNIFDYKLGNIVPVMSFGMPDEMEVIGYDESTNQVKLKCLNAQGSAYYTPEKLEDHIFRINNMKMITTIEKYESEDIVKDLRALMLGVMTILEYSLVNKEIEQSDLLALLSVKIEKMIDKINTTK